MSVKEYKCPCCGGNLVFNSDTQKLHCPSCDNEMDMETYRELCKGGRVHGAERRYLRLGSHRLWTVRRMGGQRGWKQSIQMPILRR
mgnify:CR=1 FL=1